MAKKGMRSRTSWRSKLEKDQDPQLIEVEVGSKWEKIWGGGKMLIPTPKMVDALLQQVPKGELATVPMLRNKLAADCEASYSCPLTTGIFLRIAAETAEEDKAGGQTEISPYWRIIKEDGSLNEKFPGGVEQQKQYLEAEGFDFSEKQTKTRIIYKVTNFQTYLTTF